MKLNEVHHIAVTCSDYNKAKEFYIDKLGFRFKGEKVRKEKGDIILYLEINENTELELFIKSDAPARITHPESLGLRHLAFRVTDIEKTVEELESLGIECEPIRTDSREEKKFTFFFDPDGQPIELHQ